MKYQAIRGMSDLLPPEVQQFELLERKTREFLNLLSYNEIRTPIVEYTELFVRSIGEATDIVNKEMYCFEDRKGRSLTLRPEMTASVVRAVIENNLLSKDETSRFFYIGPMFRAERPQAGRRRQFHQIGIELFGSQTPYQDADVIGLLNQFFLSLGLPAGKFQIKINNIGNQKNREAYNAKLKQFLTVNKMKLGPDDQRRMATNVLRVLDSKDPKTRKVCEEAPLISDYLDSASQKYHERVLELLSKNNVSFREDPRLVRGLDYYQQTVFEVVGSDLGAQDAVGAGGRYDGLVKALGGPDLGGIGFAIGMERLLLTLNESANWMARETRHKLVYIVHSGSDPSKEFCLSLQKTLVEAGIRCSVDFVKDSIKSQMRLAGKKEADFVVIAGDDEMKKGEISLKNMKDGSQSSLKSGELAKELKNES